MKTYVLTGSYILTYANASHQLNDCINKLKFIRSAIKEAGTTTGKHINQPRPASGGNHQ